MDVPPSTLGTTIRGGCNGSTRSFGVLCRGSNPRPRATHPREPTQIPRSRADGEFVSPYRPLAAVVLAAGEGARLRSGTPKVLHELCGRPMVLHVVDALAELRVL